MRPFKVSLVMIITTALVGAQSQYTGDPAFTAFWYTKEGIRNSSMNDFGYLDLLATNTLPLLPFTGYSGPHPDTVHLLPPELRTRMDFYGLHIFATCSPPRSGTYRFSMGGDDGFRLISNGRIKTKPNNYRIRGFEEEIFEMTLSANEDYLWEVHYFENSSDQGLHFKVEVDGVWKYVDSDWCKPTTPPASINFAGKAYRALDWTEPSSNESSCQGDNADSATFLFHDVPVESNDIYALLSRYKFGTECMIVRKASNVAEFVALKTHPVDLTPSNRYCDMTGITVSRTFGSFRVSGDTSCDFRFLIETDTDPSLVDHAYVYTQHGTVHSIFFKEALFATLQNVLPSVETAGIRNYGAYKLPPGYSLAPNDGLTKGALLGSAFKFGLQCVLLADGTAQNTETGTACSADSGFDSTNLPGYYVVTGKDIADIFIKNPNGRKVDAIESWDETSGRFIPALGVHLVQSVGWLYGAVAGTSPTLVAATMCQDRALELPKGYSLVPPGDKGLLEVAHSAWFGSTCLVMSDGSGYTPGTGSSCTAGLAQAKYNGKDYLATSTCPSVVMMRRRQSISPTRNPTLLERPAPTTPITSSGWTSSSSQGTPAVQTLIPPDTSTITGKLYNLLFKLNAPHVAKTKSLAISRFPLDTLRGVPCLWRRPIAL